MKKILHMGIASMIAAAALTMSVSASEDAFDVNVESATEAFDDGAVENAEDTEDVSANVQQDISDNVQALPENTEAIADVPYESDAPAPDEEPEYDTAHVTEDVSYVNETAPDEGVQETETETETVAVDKYWDGKDNYLSDDVLTIDGTGSGKILTFLMLKNILPHFIYDEEETDEPMEVKDWKCHEIELPDGAELFSWFTGEHKKFHLLPVLNVDGPVSVRRLEVRMNKDGENTHGWVLRIGKKTWEIKYLE